MTNMLDHVVAAAQGWHIRQLKYKELVPPHLWDRDADPEKLTDTWAWFNEKEKLQRFERTYSPTTVIGISMELLKGKSYKLMHFTEQERPSAELRSHCYIADMNKSEPARYTIVGFGTSIEVAICYSYLKERGRM